MKAQCSQVCKEAILRTIMLKDLHMTRSAVETHCPLDMLIARHLYKILDMLWTTGRRPPDMAMKVPTSLLHLVVMLLPHIEDSHLHMIQSQAEILMVDAQDLHKILMQGNVEDSRDDVSSMTLRLLLVSINVDASNPVKPDHQSFLETNNAVCAYGDRHTLIGINHDITLGGDVPCQAVVRLAAFSNV